MLETSVQVGHAEHLVNFFGHALVGSWFSAEPAFIAGAMLPDFLSMLGGLRGRASSESLAKGIALHHATDAAFHATTGFLQSMREARSALEASGLGRAPARATAHVGVELLLDEAWLGDITARTAYFSALAHAATAPHLIEWADPDGASRLSDLLAALSERGLPTSPVAPESVASRIRRALSRHPRLALGDPDEPCVADWVVAARRPIVGCAPLILRDVHSRLLAAGFSPVVEPIPRRQGEALAPHQEEQDAHSIQ